MASLAMTPHIETDDSRADMETDAERALLTASYRDILLKLFRGASELGIDIVDIAGAIQDTAAVPGMRRPLPPRTGCWRRAWPRRINPPSRHASA